MGNSNAKFNVCEKFFASDVLVTLIRASFVFALTYYTFKYVLAKLDPTGKSKRIAKKVAAAQLKRLNSRSGPQIDWQKFSDHEMMIAAQLVVPEDIPIDWKSIAGLETVVQEMRELVVFPLCHPELTKQSKLWQPPRGVLLYGPPGCGKTLIAKATAKEAGMHFINLDIAMLTDKWYGESQKIASAVFSLATKIQPCIIFIDEIDAFLRSRTSKDHEATAMIKAQFMTLWDGLGTNSNSTVVVMGATNRPGDLDQAILRRMPTQFHIGLPAEKERSAILKVILQSENVSDDVDFQQLAQYSIGLSGSDLHEMCRHASMLCIRQAIRKNESNLSAVSDTVCEPAGSAVVHSADVCITMEDLKESLRRVLKSKVHLMN